MTTPNSATVIVTQAGNGQAAVIVSPGGLPGPAGASTTVTAGDASITVGGSPAAPTIETGTLDQVAALHPPAASWSNNGQKITSVANGSAAQDAAAFGQTPAGGNTVTIGQGGTGQTGQQAALDTLAGAVTSGDYLRGNGTHVLMSAIQAADVPVLNQNTTGTASNITGTLDQVPAAAANVSLGGHKITSLANGSASSDAAAFGQLPSSSSPLPLNEGGTGTSAASANAAYNALSPMTTTGDMEYESATGVASRLAGPTSATKQFLTSTGTGSAAQAPAWGTIASGDLPAATTGAQGAVILTGTASDIQNTGPQAAGNSTKAAPANHVHFSSGMFLCAPHVYNPGTPANPAVSSTTLTAFDTTNITTNSFTAPASANVLVTASFQATPSATVLTAYGLSDHASASSLRGNAIVTEISSGTNQNFYNLEFVVTGLTTGNSYQFDLLGATASGSVTIHATGQSSTAPTATIGAPVVMKVIAI